MPLGTRSDCGDARFCGLEVGYPRDLGETLEVRYEEVAAVQDALNDGFDFVSTSLSNPASHDWPWGEGRGLSGEGCDSEGEGARPAPAGAFPPPPEPWTRSDLTLTGAQWSGQVVGCTSNWLALDSSDERLAEASEAAFFREVAWASHLGLQAIVVGGGARGGAGSEGRGGRGGGCDRGAPGERGTAGERGAAVGTARPSPSQPTRTARALAAALELAKGAALWVRLPLAPEGGGDDAWEWWDGLRRLAEHSPRLGLALELPAASPSKGGHGALADLLARWGGENVKAVLVPREAFALNKRGYPALAKPYAAAVSAAFACGIQVIVTGADGAGAEVGGGVGTSQSLAEAEGGKVAGVVVPSSSGPSSRTVPDPAPSLSSTAAPDSASLPSSTSAPDSASLPSSTSAPDSAPRPDSTTSTSSPAALLSATGDEDGWPALRNPGSAAAATSEAPGAPPPPPPSPPRACWEYLSYLFRKLPVPYGPAGAPCDGSDVDSSYRDLLQAPLQPLADNLESATYETFERDVIKYRRYRDAMASAILEIRRGPLASASTSTAAIAAGAEEETIVIAVCGAGRGPLVQASLEAADELGARVQVYAVEKNRNALVTLAHRAREEERWAGRVSVVPGDMRAWAARGSVDVLVSELLGSFGDNELSPECIDGALACLSPRGICIPRAYTSYLQPVTAHGPWNDARGSGDRAALETPYVVQLHRVRQISPPQRCFTFDHPNPSGPSASAGAAGAAPVAPPRSNERHATLVFANESSSAACLHGFAGYFDALLHGDATLSTLPSSHTPGMHSWFPIFFPLRHPVTVPAGGTVAVSVERRLDSKKVWYEWWLSDPEPSPIHNLLGRSYAVGL